MALALAKLFGMAAVLAAVPLFAHASEPIALNDSQMDMVTAGVAINLDLAATATGPTTATSTSGKVQVGTANVLTVTGDAKSGYRLVGDSPAQVAFGGGQATASGATDANCTAQIAVVGNLAYLKQISAATTMPTSAICTCAALAISFTPR